MYFDLDDHRPDTPRTPSVISRREGVLLSIIAHLVLALAFVLMPKSFFEAAPAQVPPPSREPIRFVSVQPRVERPATPSVPADQSDMDRRSATRETAPRPENTAPLSRGDTPEKIDGARAERSAGPEAPPAAATSAVPPDLAAKVLPETPAAPKPAPPGGSLGERLRNLQSYLQGQSFDNPRGGQTQNAPDIQFDSKGVDFGPWIRRFRAQVMSNWFVPETAMFLKGRVVLQFYVHRDGSITELRVVAPSTVESFTTAAFSAMKLSNPTMPLPPEYPTDKVLFTVTFLYNERY
jgi:TonB family protein